MIHLIFPVKSFTTESFFCGFGLFNVDCFQSTSYRLRRQVRHTMNLLRRFAASSKFQWRICTCPIIAQKIIRTHVRKGCRVQFIGLRVRLSFFCPTFVSCLGPHGPQMLIFFIRPVGRPIWVPQQQRSRSTFKRCLAHVVFCTDHATKSLEIAKCMSGMRHSTYLLDVPGHLGFIQVFCMITSAQWLAFLRVFPTIWFWKASDTFKEWIK